MIEAKVQEKEKAKEKYEDVIAGGNLGVIAERKSKGQQVMTIKIGNLLPR